MTPDPNWFIKIVEQGGVVAGIVLVLAAIFVFGRFLALPLTGKILQIVQELARLAAVLQATTERLEKLVERVSDRIDS